MSGRLPIWEIPLSENSRTKTTERHGDLTMTLSYPFEFGRSVMKSIVIVSHIPCGILLGLSGTLTGGLIFVVWQTAYPLMYALTNSVIPGHQYSHMISSMVFHCSG